MLDLLAELVHNISKYGFEDLLGRISGFLEKACLYPIP